LSGECATGHISGLGAQIGRYDFSKAKRAKNIPQLARLQAESKGKTRITIMLDNDLLVAFRAKADAEGTGYQTLVNQTQRQAPRVGDDKRGSGP
jgi:uncharacterized protein (DUF4415 family)